MGTLTHCAPLHGKKPSKNLSNFSFGIAIQRTFHGGQEIRYELYTSMHMNFNYCGLPSGSEFFVPG